LPSRLIQPAGGQRLAKEGGHGFHTQRPAEPEHSARPFPVEHAITAGKPIKHHYRFFEEDPMVGPFVVFGPQKARKKGDFLK
jgi:hypothetical protein